MCAPSCAGADPGGGRWGARPPLGRSFTIQSALFNNIQAPVHHWAPTAGRNPISASVVCDFERNRSVNETKNQTRGLKKTLVILTSTFDPEVNITKTDEILCDVTSRVRSCAKSVGEERKIRLAVIISW